MKIRSATATGAVTQAPSSNSYNRSLASIIARRATPILAGTGLLIPFAVQAADISVVDGATAVISNDGICGLAEAVANANDTNDGQPFADCTAGDPAGADTITLPANGSFIFDRYNNYADGVNALPSVSSQITIQGNDSTVERGNAGSTFFRLIHVASGGDLTLNDLTLSGGVASSGGGIDDMGGAIFNRGTLTVNNSTVTGNTAFNAGGGIASFYAAGTTTISNSTVSVNSASAGGGGIYAYYASTAYVTNSTVSGNTATRGGGLAADGYYPSTISVRNSTISGNSATTGGGVYTRNSSVVDLKNATLAANSATTGGNLASASDGVVTTTHSLIANPVAGNNCQNSGTFTSLAVNLADDASCAGATYDADVGTYLGALGNNGGPTQTHLLLAGNPAIDGGDQPTCQATSVDTDQRAVARPQDGNTDGTDTCDVGAVELFAADAFAGIMVDDGVVDPTDGDGNCSLVEAIHNANDTESLGQPYVDCARGNYNGADTITLPTDSEFTFASANDSADGGSALPAISSEITITGNGATVQREAGSGDDFRVINVLSSGNLTLQNMTVSGGNLDSAGITGSGGGILNRGTLYLDSVTVSGNSVSGGGRGAGIHNRYATLTLENSTIIGNTASGFTFGGGIDSTGSPSTVSINNSVVSGNSATLGGAMSAVLGTLSFSNSQIVDNVSAGNGGGLYVVVADVSISDTTLSGNTAELGSGGALLAASDTTSFTVNITNSTIAGNSARGYGGGVFTQELAEINVFSSTLSGNTADRGGGGAAYEGGTLNLTNTTVSGNTAPGQGGGLYVYSGQLTLSHSTVAGNYGTDGAGLSNGAGTVTIINSLIANNSGDDNCAPGTNFVATGNNLANDQSCTGAVYSAAAGSYLGALADNGGPTQTHLLLTGNPAIDGGDQTACDANSVTTDQRGLQRPLDGNGDTVATCDVGAVEVFVSEPIVVDAGVVDPTDGDGNCSLIEAIGNANDTANFGQLYADCNRGNYNGVDTISLPVGSTFSAYNPASYEDGSNAVPSITTEVVIEGNGAAVERDQGTGQNMRLFHVGSTGNLTLRDLTVTGGTATDGGGLLNRGTLTLEGVTVSGNSAADGGGIWTTGLGSQVNLTGSTVAGNTASGYGGGLHASNYADVQFGTSTVAGNSAGNGGGGVYVKDSSGVSLTQSTISGNAAAAGGGGVTVSNSSGLNLYNSTVSGNSAGYFGGGIAASNGSGVNLVHATLSGNESPNYGSAFLNEASTVTLTNSLIVNPAGTQNCSTVYGGTTTGSGVNLTDDDSCSDAINNPAAGVYLGALANNGGPTQTHLLLSGNPAIDGADQVVCDANTDTDQRGLARPQDGNGDATATCDVGAVEVFVAEAIEVDAGVVDPTNGDGQCSLIEAIHNANDTDNFGQPYSDCARGNYNGADTISLASSSTFSFATYHDAADSTNALPPITSVITIEGNDSTIERNSGASTAFRLLDVDAAGTLMLTDATVSGGLLDSSVSGAGAGIRNAGTVNLTNVTLSGNTASFGRTGSGLYNNGTAALMNTTVSSNYSTNGGAGAGVVSSGPQITITESTLTGNRGVSGSHGGGLDVANGTATITNTEISSNESNRAGGGIRAVGATIVIDGGAFMNNYTGRSDGFGYFVDSTVSITNSTISGNSADRSGGALFAYYGTTVTVRDSTLSGNTASNDGGAVHAYAYYDDSVASVSIINSTLSGNSSSGDGGAVSARTYYDGAQSTVNLIHSTLVGNTAPNGAGVAAGYDAEINATNSLFANNIGDNCNGSLIAGIGVNLSDDASCSAFTFDVAAGDLDALSDNGGPTLTHLPQPTNPAIDGGDQTACDANGITTDQRGEDRPMDGDSDGTATCDVGAVEVESNDLDGDGLPNDYETTNGLDPNDDGSTDPVNGADGDLDQDGFTNIEEFNAGTAANNPDSDGDGLGDAIDADPANSSNACIQDGNGDAQFDFTAMSGMVTQCAADNSILVLDAANAVIESGSTLQLYSLTVSFDIGAAVPVGATVQTVIGDPAPGTTP